MRLILLLLLTTIAAFFQAVLFVVSVAATLVGGMCACLYGIYMILIQPAVTKYLKGKDHVQKP